MILSVNDACQCLLIFDLCAPDAGNERVHFWIEYLVWPQILNDVYSNLTKLGEIFNIFGQKLTGLHEFILQTS